MSAASAILLRAIRARALVSRIRRIRSVETRTSYLLSVIPSIFAASARNRRRSA
jgi:hypothetical protein